MRKCITLIIICLLTAPSLMAQKKSRSTFGLKTGINFSTFSLEGSGTSNNDAAWKTGLVLGGYVTIPVSTNFSIEPNFLYSSMGGVLKEAGNEEGRYRLNYFSIPVLGKYKVSKCFTVVGGLQGDILIQAKKVTDNEGTFKVTNDFEDHDFALSLGAETYFFNRLSLGARYMHGLTDLSSGATTKIKNRGIQLALGVNL